MIQQKLLRLDNASFIYPASLSKKYASLYRMSVTLSEPVDVEILQQALERTVDRIPTFGYTLTGAPCGGISANRTALSASCPRSSCTSSRSPATTASCSACPRTAAASYRTFSTS